MSNLFVIDGQAGAGKTPLVTEIVRVLNEERGVKAFFTEPFKLANQYVIDNDLLTDYPLGIYSFWGKSVERAVFAEDLLNKYIEDSIKEAKDYNGIVISDRGWLTICMGILESAHNKNEKENRIKLWMDKKIPTFFLDTRTNITQSRKSWNPLLPWTNENINSDFNNRREYILKHDNLLDRYEVLESTINLNKLANLWCDKIICYK